ncbi:MAG: UTP--glucose-1-phosphate uridylyltransferase [Candidatus Coproplasma sp.]
MNFDAAEALLEKYNQQHVLHYYSKLSDNQKETLLSTLEEIDFSAFKTVDINATYKLGELSPADALSLKDVKKQNKRFTETGLSAIRGGKVCVVILAGGQGTRLGYDGPKGTFNIGVNRQLSIFECLINNLKEVVEKSGVAPYVFIMTSRLNDTATRKFFEDNAYFGYDPKKINFYLQGVAPAIDFEGKILMEEKYRPVLTPDGNGGWYAALVNAGFGKLLKKQGIEWVNVVSVDNVLQRICDPVFIGATISSGVSCGAKVVKKLSPEEKVGVLCKENGTPTVVEYFDMPQKYKVRHDTKGELVYCYGVTLNYLFNVDKLKDTLKGKLRYHLSAKKIPCIKGGKKFVPEEPNGYKLEQLATDMVSLSGSCVAVEIDREKEFAPVKNKSGADSVDTARALLIKNSVEI